MSTLYQHPATPEHHWWNFKAPLFVLILQRRTKAANKPYEHRTGQLSPSTLFTTAVLANRERERERAHEGTRTKGVKVFVRDGKEQRRRPRAHVIAPARKQNTQSPAEPTNRTPRNKAGGIPRQPINTAPLGLDGDDDDGDAPLPVCPRWRDVVHN